MEGIGLILNSFEAVKVMSNKAWASSAQGLAALIVAAALPALTGCSGFFPPVNGGGGGGGTTGNYVYVANSNANSIGGFSIGTGTLTAVANSPLALGYTPVTMVVTPSNSFLYVASASTINVYLIGANGSLTVPTGGATAAVATVASMDVSPDGNWLFGLDSLQHLLDVYQINKTTGALAATGNVTYTLPPQAGTWVPRKVRVAPNGSLIYAAIGTAGDVIFTFNTLTGAATFSQNLAIGTTTSDNALAIDSNSAYLYIARSGIGPGVAVYGIGANGQLTAATGSPFAAGAQTFSIALNSTNTYVYAANRTDSTISGYTIGTGAVLTPLSGSPYTSGSLVTSIGIERTGKYLLAAANGGSPDLTMYSFDIATPGKLDPATSIATGTEPAGAVAIALTH
jgi:6-phosphogluconolactonase